jgi:ankyrin repeat protein
VKELANSGWQPYEIDVHGSTALSWAAGGGHLHVCKFLVHECGLHVDGPRGSALSGISKKQHKRLRSPLHWAARHGHLHVCRCGPCLKL